MKFALTITSAWGATGTVELNTLEDLLNFMKEKGEDLVLPPLPDYYNEPEMKDAVALIEIYDDYRE